MNLSTSHPSKPDILIVDDTPANLRLLSKMMSESGYNVRQAINGKMALTAVKTVKPDLILLDINMPGMSGYEVCEILKKDQENSLIPIIFLSALDDIQDKVKGFKVGGIDYITKPFQFEEVVARIENQLTIKNLKKKLQTQNEKLQTTLNELQYTQAQLVQNEKMVGLMQLVAGIAHEINNPISFISGNLEPAHLYIQDLLNIIKLYQTEYPNPSEVIQKATEDIEFEFMISDLQKLMNSMKHGVDRIKTVILALRIFSRLDESEIKPVNLQEGIDSTLLLLQHRLKPDGKRPEIDIIKDYDNTFPPVTCYASQINQVFLNLLNNAIDAIEIKTRQNVDNFKPTILIASHQKDPQTVLIRIKDNGIGIPETIKPRLFEAFFTTKSVGQGKGLGLLTCYQIIVDKHNGALHFDSTEGEGTEFQVEIPVHHGKIS